MQLVRWLELVSDKQVVSQVVRNSVRQTCRKWWEVEKYMKMAG